MRHDPYNNPGNNEPDNQPSLFPMNMGGMDNTGMGLAGSSYLRGMDNNQFNDSREDENWDNSSQSSEADDFQDCEERGEFLFENRARYKG